MSTTIKATAEFVIEHNRAKIELSTERDHVSFVGRYNGSAGQNKDSFRDFENDDLQFVLSVWDSLHLRRNGELTADDWRALDNARKALEALNGTRLPGGMEGGDAADFEEASFSNSDDTIDSRDVISRIEYLTDFLADIPNATEETYNPDEDPHGNRNDAIQELKVLRELESQASDYAPDWEYGETLIRDSYFEEYAEELANDCGMLQRAAKWPNNHIDWEAAANELKGDYTSIEFDGVTYWIR